MAMSDYSLSDIAAVTDGGANRSNAGWDNGSWWWIILLFLVCGWGGNGWGANGNGGGFNGAGAQGALTRGDLCMDMNFQDVQSGVRNVNDAVTLGFANLNSTICNQQYDTARMINAVQADMNAGFNAMNISNLQTANAANIANLQSTNAIQSQIAQCCCEEREAIANVNYNMAQQTCAITNTIQNSTRDIVEATNAGTRAILDQLCQDKIDTLQNQLNKAELLASQTAQNQYLISQLRPQAEPAYIVPNPFANYGNWGYNNGCGCGC